VDRKQTSEAAWESSTRMSLQEEWPPLLGGIDLAHEPAEAMEAGVPGCGQKRPSPDRGARRSQYRRSDGMTVRIVNALGRFGDRQAVSPIITMLHEGRRATVRSTAAIALGRIDDPAAIPVLRGLLDDDDRATRMWAIRSLGQLRDQRRSSRQSLGRGGWGHTPVRSCGTWRHWRSSGRGGSDGLLGSSKLDSADVFRLAPG
jgi:hypothetical protein